ncbi:hypothetical protein JHL21_02555 [Devosia sp. WQ 349]|uniref:hypothetical protein n=1 Tax=Devosia sp. WQ 349K1 TaxID=2800329 RepID=UPI001906C8C1|nr:hypothetical protein [Devosia sp. WQ 349K1]MBK1793377.1 hypothetical protein [Devosia sp. WQ 349K1]
MKARATTQKLGLGMTTDEGAFFPKVDGKPVGENGQAFWSTRAEAQRVANRFLTKLIESEKIPA